MTQGENEGRIRKHNEWLNLEKQSKRKYAWKSSYHFLLICGKRSYEDLQWVFLDEERIEREMNSVKGAKVNKLEQI